MRTRPTVKLVVQPAVVRPGQPFVLEAQLTSRTETPVDFVHVRFTGREQLAERVGNSRVYHRRKIVEQEVHHEPGTCGVQPRNTFFAELPLSHSEIAQATSGALPVSARRRSRTTAPEKSAMAPSGVKFRGCGAMRSAAATTMMARANSRRYNKA